MSTTQPKNAPVCILAIESSCDDTGAAICLDGKVISNIVANQSVHQIHGGVVPELASRAHEQNIIPAVDLALKAGGVRKEDLSAVAFTQGPGLMGSLLVGTSFAKAFALGLSIPLVAVNHLQGHVLAHFIKGEPPKFPFLCLLVSGGHTQILQVNDYFTMQVIGQTTDDAAGEAFDKTAKMLGLPYPGGVLIDRWAKSGNPFAFSFPEPRMPGLNFSFSGLKTAFMLFIQKQVKLDRDFIEANLADICASVQERLVSILISKLTKASEQTGIKEVALAGGVSANSGLRKAFAAAAALQGWNTFVPDLEYCTDNAGMIAIAGYYKFLKKDFSEQDVVPQARFAI